MGDTQQRPGQSSLVWPELGKAGEGRRDGGTIPAFRARQQCSARAAYAYDPPSVKEGERANMTDMGFLPPSLSVPSHLLITS